MEIIQNTAECGAGMDLVLAFGRYEAVDGGRRID
jgi:hypothetical protein